jgi:predicted ATPase
VNSDRRLLTRIALRNYKSIGACNVSPAQLTFLVGPNGAGKSNFLDALRFVADSLRFSIDHALRDRGGIREVRRRSSGHPTHFTIRLDFSLDDRSGYFAFLVGAKRRAGYHIQREECWVATSGGDNASHHYRVEDGRVVKSTLPAGPVASSDRLYLVSASGLDEFRPVYDALSNTGFYNLSPVAIRDLQPPDPGEVLNRDGSNIASVFARLDEPVRTVIKEYLGRIVPGVTGVERVVIGPRETLRFRQHVQGAQYPWRFDAGNISDGALRACGVLVALFQGAGAYPSCRSLVGIEEPEVALHPAAAEILFDSLQDAAQHTQVLVTSHSPDLLDNHELPDDSILAVVAEDGETRIGPLDEVGRSALRDHLYTAGELLRMNQLGPDPAFWDIPAPQLNLFGPLR